ncbi:MAG: bifunctional DNA-formamidopyrimidine glycosylase/DNA-(apurinic or apyrimidinic site) lyase [Pseudomonadota bacterium]
MPELPEVETVRRGLAPYLEGATIANVTLKRSDLRFPFPDRFARRLKGAAILRADRRAKYLLFHLSNNEVLIIHLGMSGRLRIERSKLTQSPGDFYDSTPASTKHDHVVIDLQAQGRLIYNDARRFGFMELIAANDIEKRFEDLGLEPLSAALNGKSLKKLFENKKVAIKLALLDQSLIAGIGNIYACEALFDAKVSPKKAAGKISLKESEWLSAAVKKVLKKAIKYGGSTLRDFHDADGKSGEFQNRFNVYDRKGQPCPQCKTPIERMTQGGRSTFYCPRCQR